MNTLRKLIVGTTPTLIGERELIRRRILRVLADRERYRYVQPDVVCIDGGWLVTSPCCSRNVDPAGGVILIARIERRDESWRLLARDHAQGEWVDHGEFARLDTLLHAMCRDPQRVIWP